MGHGHGLPQPGRARLPTDWSVRTRAPVQPVGTARAGDGRTLRSEEMSTPGQARYGWASDLQAFTDAAPGDIARSLADFVRNASPEQLRVWASSIPWLQDTTRITVELDRRAASYSTILEYELPLEFRRPDVIVLENGVILVVELKDKAAPTQADLDQVGAYARDLRAYHVECHHRTVYPLLVPSRAKGRIYDVDGVRVVPPADLAQVLLELSKQAGGPPLTKEAFLRADAYAPLPTLVRAARELFHHGGLTRIERARAATEPALRAITDIAHEAARTRTRRLVLLSGLPGSGKTLVGLQLVHAHFLDDLSVPRTGGAKPSSPAVFLSGNGSLVSVLQDALKGAGGGGRTFVASVKGYVKQYSSGGHAPPHHLLVFDEAQRAWDADQVASKQPDTRGLSEPELFIEFAERVPEWCVVVALIGTGQEIHKGEEGGIALWRAAVERSRRSGEWTVHTPPALAPAFDGIRNPVSTERALNLDVELRYHAARHLHDFVAKLLAGAPPAECAALADLVHEEGARLFLTRDVGQAKAYVRERYAGFADARYGILGSSRDKHIAQNGPAIPGVNRFDVARWFNAPEHDPRACGAFELAASEFACQGLELDFAIVWWGQDFLRERGAWSIARSTRYQAASKVQDPFRLRLNAYRVLLTRGRDGFVVYVPPGALFDATAEHLRLCGLRPLAQEAAHAAEALSGGTGPHTARNR